MEKSIQFNGSTIIYEVEGNGSPVLLVHGFAEDNTVWRKISAELSGNYRLILPQLPGTGRSDLLSQMSMDSMAATLCAILDEENIATCPVIGHSMGGYITMAMADKYSNRVMAIGLFHSSAYADTDEKKKARREGIRSIQTKGAEAFLKKTIPNLFAPGTQSAHPELVIEQVNRAKHFTSEALVAYYEAMIDRPDRRSVLENSKVPVLFIIGKQDTAIPPADMLQQSHLPQLSQVHTFQESGHLGMLEEPALAVRVVHAFLDLAYRLA